MLRIYQEICALASDSVLIIALTLVTPFTEQETEAKKEKGGLFLGQNLYIILAHVMFSTVLVSRTNCPQFENAVK